MTALYYPPKFDSGLPGAKLWFYQTGTTTPQNTYTDAALVTPSSNPVVADADGVFAPIYLDPTLPNYRVKYTTSADVLLYQVDGVPSNQGVQQAIRLESTSPSVVLFDTDGTTNKRKYRIRASGSQLLVEGLNDNETVTSTLITAENGIVAFPYGSTVTDGDGVANTMVGTQISSYTGTLTGISGTDPTGTINYVRVGSLVTLNIPNAGSGFAGTSDSTSMTITGMPTAIRPSAARVCPFPAVGDNGNLIGDGEAVWVEIGTSGTITFYINGSSTGFTASGTKSTSAGGCISYII